VEPPVIRLRTTRFQFRMEALNELSQVSKGPVRDHLMPDNETLLGIVFVALIGIALLGQAVVMLAMYIAVRKAIKSVRSEFDEFRAIAMPMIGEARGILEKTRGVVDDTQQFMARVAPKAEATMTDLADIAQGLRKQAVEVEATAQEILGNVRRQGNRIDSMFSGALDTADRAGTMITAAVATPARKLSAILASAKAVIGTFRSYDPPSQRRRAAEENETFI